MVRFSVCLSAICARGQSWQIMMYAKVWSSNPDDVLEVLEVVAHLLNRIQPDSSCPCDIVRHAPMTEGGKVAETLCGNLAMLYFTFPYLSY